MFRRIKDMGFMNGLLVVLTMCLHFGLLDMLTGTIILLYTFSVPGQMIRHVDFTKIKQTNKQTSWPESRANYTDNIVNCDEC
jgi:hypothetical protein